MQKKILGQYTNSRGHWVGDGFPVRSLFSYTTLGERLSPFLLFDYTGPYTFTPTDSKRGVGQHPHRGFETVTLVYEGEVEHRDSSGGGGVIGPGDVQWMTAGRGILHEEYHSPAFARSGGPFRVVQLWVNLPAKDKATPAAYQSILAADIPNVALPQGAGTVRVIAGDYDGTQGPAHTFSPINVWDIRLKAGTELTLPVPEGHGAAVVVLDGQLVLEGDVTLGDAELVVLDRAGAQVSLRAGQDTSFVALSGQPLDEPIVGHGPFVMNTQEEINQAVEDFNSGRFLSASA